MYFKVYNLKYNFNFSIEINILDYTIKIYLNCTISNEFQQKKLTLGLSL